MTKDQPRFTKQQRDLIVDRIEKIERSCNSYYINHQIGVLRGMLWIITSEDPGDAIEVEHIARIMAAYGDEEGEDYEDDSE